MAERLGAVHSLRSAGIVPIPPSKGISLFRRLVNTVLPCRTVIVTGRLGATSPVSIDGPALPSLRFLERIRVHYPGVELVAEADVSLGSDPYLQDHIFQGQPLLPAVMGLEAMVQVAMAVSGRREIPVIENVSFEHPIAIESGIRVTLRLVALVREEERIDVAIRSSLTSFQVEHFRCTCSFAKVGAQPRATIPLPEPPNLQLDPQRELYGSLFFQGRRFQRLSGYRRLRSRFSWAHIDPAPQEGWFTPYLNGKLILGDAAARDAAIHSLQACVPQATLLPVSVDRISATDLIGTEPLVAYGVERWQDGADYCYDVELRSTNGEVCERWEGLRLHKIADAKLHGLPDQVAAAALEWGVRRALPHDSPAVAFERNDSFNRRLRTERAIRHAVDAPCSVTWSVDGKPEVDAPFAVSAAHCGNLTLAVASHSPVACDIESVCERSDEMWRDLLGQERWLLAKVVATQVGEDIHSAATRVWTAMESLAKAAIPQHTALTCVSASVQAEGSVQLASQGLSIFTSVIKLTSDPRTAVVAVLAGSETCAATNTDTKSPLMRRIS